MAWNLKTSHADTYVSSESADFPGCTAPNQHLESCVPIDDNIFERLNDDCIIHIFEQLPLSDLCSVVDVCKKFRSIALSVFKRNHFDIDLDELIQNESESESEDLNVTITSGNSACVCDDCCNMPTPYNPILPIDEVKEIIRHFGSYIGTIRISAEDKEQGNEILNLLATHCTNQNADLDKLIMTDVNVSKKLMPRFRPLFDRLQCLEVTNSPFHIGSELTELVLDDVYLDCVLTRRLEKLQGLCLFDVNETIPGALKSLSASPPHLKRLNISGWILPLAILKDQSSLTPELEEITVVDAKMKIGDIQHVNSLATLDNLKAFSFDCSGFSITEVLNNFVEHNVPIEELCLSNVTISTNAGTNLIKLSKLKKLRLSDGGWVDDVKVPEIVKGIPILEELCLCNFGLVTVADIKAIIANVPKLNFFQLNYQQDDAKIIVGPIDFNEICRDIAKRSDGHKLHLDICAHQCKLNVSEHIIERNRQLLEVKIITYNKVQSIDIIDYYGYSDDDEVTYINTIDYDEETTSEDDP